MPTVRKVTKYGWRRDLPDHRDRKFILRTEAPALPRVVDNRPNDWGLYNQGHLGSCTANSSLSGYRNVLKREGLPDFEASRLAQYYWTRCTEGTCDQDAGASIRDAIKTIGTNGVAPESLWPYIEEKFNVAPGDDAIAEAKNHIALAYESVSQNLDDLCAAIVRNGNLVFGFSVFLSFERLPADHIVPLPAPTDAVQGGHAVCAVGYDLDKGVFIVKNSWGSDWGDGGYFYMPLDFILNPNLANDFWTMSVTK